MKLRLVRTAAETNGDLLEMEATYEPGSVEPLEHFHPNQDEHFEIVTGTIEARIGGERPSVRWETRPALRTEEFFRTIGALAQDGRLTPRGPKDPLVGAAVMQEFRNEFRPTTPPAAVQAIAFPVLSVVARALGRRP
jgi:hypothetical protein